MERERIFQVLRNDLSAATRRFHQAEEFLDSAMRPSSITYPDAERQNRIRLASRAYGAASAHLRTAIDRLNRFRSDGISPPEIKPASSETGLMPTSFKQSA